MRGRTEAPAPSAKLCIHRLPADGYCKRCEAEKGAKDKSLIIAAAKLAKPAAAKVDDGPLTEAESTEFSKLETVIERGFATFAEVGQALVEIREARLYRAAFPTFDDYCRERWGMSSRHANRSIEAAEVTAALGPMGPILKNERQARELAPLLKQPKALRAALKEASKDGKPTAEKLRKVVREKTGKAAPKPKEDTPAIKRIDIAEFRRLGCISEINRRFLHPLGLALEVVVEKNGSERLGGVWDYRDDPEGVLFGSEELAEVGEKAARLDAEWEARRAAREAALGYMVQPVDGAEE